jgi:hypothetical protein
MFIRRILKKHLRLNKTLFKINKPFIILEKSIEIAQLLKQLNITC